MTRAIAGAAAAREHRGSTPMRRGVMKWETPQATEFRFGMEITLYVANR
jgi:coenzyme PQQ precursor peptide PqqA